MKSSRQYSGMEVAIIGMACRFPGADNWRAYWDNLINGVESLHYFSDEELIASGVDSSDLGRPDFVKAGVLLKGKDSFDSAFFDYRPGEAKLLHPLHRVFHECVWEALEDAGYDPEAAGGTIGLYAGGGWDLNWKVYSMLKNADQEIDDFTLNQLNNKDYLASLLSYKLNLKGPAFSVNTACSTSLVAINLAAKSLLFGEARMALAGGVSIVTEKKKGYVYQEGMISSIDGHCRAFDKDASGVMGGEGAGVVVLKRLEDALEDGDHIYALIKGSAINGDGNQKVGFTAPSVEGQADCIKKAQALADVAPESISYIEAHGTGTRLGDPIEVEALNIAFNRNKAHRCAIGSVKTNIGHLDTAAGVAGLMKAALSLYHRKLPASLHYREANPAIDFAGGPFYVNGSLQAWEARDGAPLRAGVSSFGIGGTNAHAVLEEAPLMENVPSMADGREGRPYQLLVLSARTEGALVRYGKALTEFIRKEESLNMGDLSYTLQAGRRGFPFRKSLAYRDRGELLSWLEGEKYKEGISRQGDQRPGVVLLLPGQGAQYTGMCRELYATEPVFRSVLEEGFEILRELTGEDFSEVLYPVTGTDLRIHDTKYTQPCLFLVEYGLARLLESYGVRAEYMLGHSLGEYVAACLGGLWSFADALRLVWKRGQLMSGLSPGGMVSVRLGEATARGYLSEGLSLAAVNGAEQCVLSGDDGAVERLVGRLEEDGVGHIKLMTSHAFHSQMQEGILELFREELSAVRWGKLEGKVLSNVTGKLLEAGEAGSAEYWVRHLRGTVRFYEGLQTLLSLDQELIYIEAGPGHSLGGLLRQAKAGLRPGASVESIALAPSVRESGSDGRQLVSALGRLWEQGIGVDWGAYHRGEVRRRVSLPTYCFEATRYVAEVDPLSEGLSGAGRQLSGAGRQLSGAGRQFSGAGLQLSESRGESLKDWVYHPVWKSVVVRGPVGASGADMSGQELKGYLFFAAPGEMTEKVAPVLREHGHVVVVVREGSDGYVRKGWGEYQLDPGSREQVDRLLVELQEERIHITDIVYSWGAASSPLGMGWGPGNRSLQLSFFGLLWVVQELLRRDELSGKRLVLLTDRLHKIVGNEDSSPIQSLGLGLLRVLSQEQEVRYRLIDADGTEGGAGAVEVAEELLRGDEREVSLRHGRRWVREYVRNTKAVEAGEGGIVRGGVYLITGGLGKVGSLLGRHLLRKYEVKLVVIGRRKREPSPLDESVYYYSADIRDRSALTAVVEAVEERLGRINGVIHAAGNVEKEDFAWCEEMSEEKALSVMGAKVAGLENLYAVFGSRNPDFVWLTSSLSTVVGGLSYGAYAAANIYMDQFVESLPAAAGNWKSVGLSEMELTEEGVSQQRPEHRQALTAEEIFLLLEWSVRLKGPAVLYETIAPLTERISRAYERKQTERPDPLEEEAKTERPLLSTSYEAPANKTEEILVKMLQDFFGIDKIGVNDGFFELGGDSLKAMVLLKKIRQEFKIDMTVKDFFERQHIRQLAVEIEGKVGMTGGPHPSVQKAVAPIHVLGPRESYQLSSFQRRMWVLSQFEDSNLAYNMIEHYRLEGTLDLPALEAAFQSLIRRHESLRTVFRESESGEVRQYIQTPEASDFHIRYRDLRMVEREQDWREELMNEEVLHPFDLSEGPLLRARVLQVEDHRWLLTYSMHHIISDGWSMGILLRELLLFYRAHEKGMGDPLPPLRIQYKEYAVWQQEQLSGSALDEHRKYWLKELQGDLPVLELPGDRVRPAVKTYRGGMVNRRMDKEVSQGLRVLVQDQGATLFMGLLAAVKVLLYRYTGQRDLLVGSPVAGRDHADLEEQIGLYLNTVVLRTRVEGTESFRSLLDRVRKGTLEVYEHQVYPLDELIEELGLRRDTSRSPLFDVLVILQNHTISNKKPPLTQENLRVERFEAGDSPTSKFDLTFSFMETGEGLEVSTEYNSDIFNKSTIERMVDHLEGLIGAVVRDSSTPVGQLAYLSAGEREKLLVSYNATASEYARDKTLVDLIGEQAVLWGDRVAVRDEEKEYSYEMLEALSDRVAAGLVARLGVDDRSPVAVLLRRSADMVIVLVGILKSGRAYIPLDGSHPAERLNYIIEQSAAAMVIQDEEAPEGIRTEGMRKIGLQELLGEQHEGIQSLATAEGMAYILYTSGSTGRPKGIAVGHRSVVNFLTSMRSSPGLAAGAVLFAVSTYSFDVSVLELFLPLISGGTVYVVGRALLSDPLRIVEKLAAMRPALMQGTPVFYQMLFEAGWKGDPGITLLCGADLLSESLSERLVSGSLAAWNMYGPTETTVWSVIKRLERGKGHGSIGKPIRNTVVYILDEGLQVVPVGVPGSIYIGGEGLAKGYYRNEALTAERFIASPFVKGDKIYDTGDVGKWNEDGEIVLMGRKDNQVKVRGHRIELGEIEGTLQSHPAIRLAAVAVKVGQDGERELVAYLVYKGEAGQRAGADAVQVPEINAYLGKLLPGYMVPSHYVVLERLPLTATGKIDRKALPDPEGLSLAAGSTYVAPRNEIEEKLVKIWQEILGKKNVGVKDDFFASGGNSLKLIRLADRIYKVFNSKIALTELFVKVRPEEQAKLIGKAKRTVYPAIDPAPVAEQYVLSPSQERLWLMEQMGMARKAYTIYGEYTFEGAVEPAVFLQAIGDLIARHESLRTIFITAEGQPWQQVLDPATLDPEEVMTDLSGNRVAARRINDLKRELFEYEFELDIWPLCRLYLVEEDGVWKVLYCMHHIISDGWSMELFIRDVGDLYRSRLTGTPSLLPALRIQYKDYAYWQNKLLQESAMNDQEHYWKEQLGGMLPDTRLPYDRDLLKERMDDLADSFQVQMDGRLKRKIDRMLKRRKSTLFSLLIACFKVMLHRLTGETDIITGIPVANREQEGLKDLIGFFVNTLMLRDQVENSMTFTVFLDQVNTTLIKGLENQSYPFERMLDKLGVKRGQNEFPISSVFLNMLNFNEQENSERKTAGSKGGLDAYSAAEGRRYAKFDMECFFLEQRDTILVHCVYRAALFGPETIGYWMRELVAIVEQVVDDPGISLQELTAFEPQITKIINYGNSGS